MTSSSATAGHRGVPKGWLLAGLVALSYCFTSLVIVLNALGHATGIVWLPSFPASYYRFSRWLYWPFQYYFTLLTPLRANPRVSYMTYALIGHAPFLSGALAFPPCNTRLAPAPKTRVLDVDHNRIRSRGAGALAHR
jgi:hypothetical protein